MRSGAFSVRLVLTITLFGSLLTACAGSSDSAGQVIEMADFVYEPAELTFRAGETVTIEALNVGDVEHDLVISSEVFALGFDAENRVASNPEIVLGRTGRVAAGDSLSLTVRFDQPGEYQYFCMIFGHFYSGMTGKITVEP